MKARDLWMYPKWRFMQFRCWIRRHHGDEVAGVHMMVPTGIKGRRRHRVEWEAVAHRHVS